MSENKITRRDLLSILFHTVPAVAVVGPSLAAAWPAEARQREVHAPVVLEIDRSGYVVDPDYDIDEAIAALPTNREYYWSKGELEAMSPEEWYAAVYYERHLEEPDPDEPQVSAEDRAGLHEWLDEVIDLEWIGAHAAGKFLPTGPGLDLHLAVGHLDLGLCLVEGDHPGSSFTGVVFRGDVDVANRKLAENGINMILRRIAS